MASLWSFFGLPDPDAPQKTTKSTEPSVSEEPSLTNQSETSQSRLTTEPIAVEQEPLTDLPEIESARKMVQIPNNWSGPITADGEPFHDLGVQNQVRKSFPSRALRYVAPDQMKRIPTRGIAQRIANGDTIIVDLRSLVHMDSHQNACRRDLKMMTDEVGVGVFALDQEDKLLMIPGTDVVVDISNHSLGINPLM
ncbi:MAG TPA: hypothetical protein HA354_03275 [Candidatus Poseidoniaceae archaeon]|nr:hypothetical protein [Euryarchaeota archaeon]DAC58705.1 MAG TPA: hypothetical protein D7I07_03250 [Candidatus Poseidoniales archaeon]HII37502.1 hypothetical protein [Candidatus Poseidoniaceae archaeon]|tara:strand:- start:667 stop:1251 length:585 start_codon:yes stop_codon:yes gene_type:complete